MGNERRQRRLASSVASGGGQRGAYGEGRRRWVGVACGVMVALVACQASEEGGEPAAGQAESRSLGGGAGLDVAPTQEVYELAVVDPALRATGRVDPRCPADTLLVGGAPPYGVELSCVQRDGVRHGPYQRWHDNGKPAATGRLERGARVGRWETYYVRSGRLESEGSYSQGLREGEWVYFYKNGRPKERARYSAGVLMEMVSVPR